MERGQSRDKEPTRGRTQTPRGQLVRYLLTILAVMAILYVIPFFLVRTSFYERWNPSFYARPLNYAFERADENADVVLFGDSTALLGVDPSQMSAALGVKVISLPNTLSTLKVIDDMALRRYLATNRAPQLIIFYFAPWDFDYGHLNLNAALMYEGEEVLAHHGTRQEIVAFVRAHPLALTAFPLTFYAAAWKNAEPRVSYRYQTQQLAATGGHVDNLDPAPLAVPCQIPQFAIDHIRFDWASELGGKYASGRTKVLFFVAPVPECGNVAAVLAHAYDELPAAAPRVMPPGDFGNSALYIHPRQSAVPAMTRNLVEAVRPALDAK